MDLKRENGTGEIQPKPMKIDTAKLKSFANPAQYQARGPVLNEPFFGSTAIARIAALICGEHQQRQVDPISSCSIEADTWIFDPLTLTETQEDDNWCLGGRTS